MKKLYRRIMCFFDLWGSYHYENHIDAAFAWSLAGICADFHDEISQWHEVKP